MDTHIFDLKRRPRISWKAALVTAGIGALLVAGLSARTLLSPSHTVRKILGKIRTLDAETLQDYFSSESGGLTDDSSEEKSDQIADDLRAFTEHFRFRVLSENVSGDTAQVTVRISNIDTRELARDVRLMLLGNEYQKQLLGEDPAADQSGMTVYSALRDCLENSDYPIKDTETTISLVRGSSGWEIQADRFLSNALVSGLISNMDDPYLLEPEEVLSSFLSRFSRLSHEEWLTFLGKSDVFATKSERAQEIDDAYADALSSCYSFRIGQKNGETENESSDDPASAQIPESSYGGESSGGITSQTVYVDITSVNLPKVMRSVREDLLSFADSAESYERSDSEIREIAAADLIDAFQSDVSERDFLLSVQMVNDGNGWAIQDSGKITDAVLGGMKDAIAALQG